MNSHWHNHFQALTSKKLVAAGTLQRAIEFFEHEHLTEKKNCH